MHTGGGGFKSCLRGIGPNDKEEGIRVRRTIYMVWYGMVWYNTVPMGKGAGRRMMMMTDSLSPPVRVSLFRVLSCSFSGPRTRKKV
eukprot:scaffold14425_cov208-Amphora_coffeaeformis.AAC.1